MTTSPLQALTSALPQLQSSGAPANGASFSAALGAALGTVEQAQASAKAATSDLLISGKGEIHNVALAAQRAELSVELFQQVRNKFVSAYQEIMRMPM